MTIINGVIGVLEIGMLLMMAGVIICMLWKGRPRENNKSTSIKSFGSLGINPSKDPPQRSGSKNMNHESQLNELQENNKSSSVKSFGSLGINPSKDPPQRSGGQNMNHESQLNVLQVQMQSALDQFQTSEDFQTLWIAVEAELRNLDETGTVPETDMDSAGLDQNNSDHLCRAFADIEDQLKEQRFEIALSRLIACRSVFIYSALHEAQDIFREDNFTILQKLFFKSYVD